MTLYSSPPPARSARQDKATLLVCWWCTCFAGVIIVFRVCGRYIRSEKLFREDRLALACLIPLLIRMALVHVILLYGTNNAITAGLTEMSIQQREIGSRLVLASRIFYTATLWMLKLTISEFFKRLTIQIWQKSHERMLLFIRYLLLVSFIAIVIADMAECQPFTHYWQVVPDPGGKCRQGYAQLLTMGVFNVITDLLLVIFPVPIIIRSQMPSKKKVQLVLLFAGSLLPAGTTLFRVPNIIDRHGSQQYRSLLASVEILFATAVANALVLGSFVRDRGVKKQRWKYGSMSDSIEQTASRRGTVTRQWGSDDDLVRDLGLGVDPELREEIAPVTRMAPMATSGNSNMAAKARRMGMGNGGVRNDWNFTNSVGEPDGMKISEETHQSAGEISSLASAFTPRKVSFFDVGGLLDDDQHSPRSPRKGSSTDRTTIDTDDLESSLSTTYTIGTGHTNTPPQGNGLSPAPPRRGSLALLQDVGGLLGPRTGISTGMGASRNNNHPSPRQQQQGGSYELQTILQEEDHHHPSSSLSLPQATGGRRGTAHSLQDVGGLLNS